MSAPCRIQLKRTKGWRMPENTVKVDRTTKWGNPFAVHRTEIVSAAAPRILRWTVVDEPKFFDSEQAAREMSIRRFRGRLMHREMKTARQNLIIELRGKNLACWCKPDEPCHADVLLEIANAGDKP